jgi:hypothetical protein
MAGSRLLLPVRCHCDGRSGVLEGVQGLSPIFEEWVPIIAMRAASDAVFAGLRGLSSANPCQAARGPLKAETQVRLTKSPYSLTAPVSRQAGYAVWARPRTGTVSARATT